LPIYYKKNDAIEGEKIVCEFRKMESGPTLIRGSSAHRANKIRLKDAFCMISTPYKKVE
jgi:hypothetical protein